jgi:hypothetical protein
MSIALQVIGITKPRYVWVKSLLGLLPKCRCQQRIDKGNELGASLRGFFSRWFTRPEPPEKPSSPAP